MDRNLTRRDLLKTTGASLAMLGMPPALTAAQLSSATRQEQTRVQRMQWWHAAKFGMFIHFGVYSTIGRHEWV
ncbi:MAG: alpha-L-fucosidase, partial [Acidobacteriaceae bacterium]|nr:alpha-L-fucosidase [Acidobacteriaceae bacterium]